MGNTNVVRQKLYSMNLYVKCYAISKFENDEIFAISNDSTLVLL